MKPELEAVLVCNVILIPKDGSMHIRDFVQRYSQDLTLQELVLVTKLGILAEKKKYRLPEIEKALTNVLEASRATTNKS